MDNTLAMLKSGFSWRLAYAFVVVWLATFAVLSPISRHEPVTYRSTATLNYQLDPAKQLSSDALMTMLKSVVGRLSEPKVLGEIRETIVPPPYRQVALGTNDVSLIRQRLSISQANRNGRLLLAISFLGKGGTDDQEFVNQLANRLATAIPHQSNQVAVAQILKANAACLDMSPQVNLAEQIRAEVAQLNESLDELKSCDNPSDLTSLPAQIQQIEKQQQELRQSQGLDDSHPRIVQLQQEIERLRKAMLGDPQYLPVQVGQQASDPKPDTVKNKYYQASAKSVAGDSEKVPWNERLASIDLSRIGSAATQIKTHAESVLDLKQDIDSALARQSESSAKSPVSLSSVEYSTAPRLIAGASLAPQWLLLVPCLVAALVVMYYNPIRDRMQLRSKGDVSRLLKLDVVGELPSGQAIATSKRSEIAAAWLVRGSEFALIAVGCLICFVSAMKPEALSVALTNPLLALSNWFWLIVS